MQVVTDTPLGSQGVPDVGARTDRTTFQTGGAVDGQVIRDVDTGIVPPDISAGGGMGTGKGSMIVAQTAQETAQLRDKIAADALDATVGLENSMADAAAGNPLTNPHLTNIAGNNAKSVLGDAPRIDMGLADRGMTAVTDATRQAGQVVDKALAPVGQTGLNQATNAARSVLDQALMGPDTTARIGAQTLRNQLALARSASGGAGGVQEAMRNAQFAAPELLSQASDAGIREQQAKLGIASQ